MFSTFVDQTLRQEIVNHLFNNVVEKNKDWSNVNSMISSDSDDQKTNSISTRPKAVFYGITSGTKLVCFSNPRSTRLKERNGLLIQALTKKKVTIGDMELAMISNSTDGRRAKRVRKR